MVSCHTSTRIRSVCTDANDTHSLSSLQSVPSSRSSLCLTACSCSASSPRRRRLPASSCPPRPLRALYPRPASSPPAQEPPTRMARLSLSRSSPATRSSSLPGVETRSRLATTSTCLSAIPRSSPRLTSSSLISTALQPQASIHLM